MVTNAREAGSTRAVQPSRRRPDGWEDVTAARVPRRGQRGRQGPDRRRHRGRRPGRPDLQDPLRVDAVRLRDLVRRRRHRADLRDLLRRAGRTGSSATPAPAPWSPRRPTTSPGSREVRGDLDELNHVWSITDNAVDTLSRLGGDISDEELEKRRTTATPARPGHADLHLRHHRPAQGLHAHPRQLHVRARRRGRRAGRALRRPRTPRRCCSCRWPTSSPGSSRSAASSPAPGWATAPTSRTCSPTSQSSSRPSSSRSPGSSRRSSTPPRSAPPPTARARSSTRPPTTAIAYSRGTRRAAGSRCAVRAKHAVFDRLVYGKLRAALGGECEYAVSGGAPLGERLGHFYRGIGLTVLEGYGLTETTAALTRQPARRDQDRHRRPAAARHRRAGRRRRRAAVPAAARCSPATGTTTTATAEVARARRLVPHRRPRRGRRRGLRPDHRAQEGDPGDRRRQERRPGRPRGPAARATCWSTSASSSATASPSSPPWSPSTASPSPPWAEQHGKSRRHRRPGRRPRPARRDRGRGRRRQQGGLEGRVDPEVHDPRRRVDRGGRPAHPEPQAQAQRRDARAQGRGRGALRG